MNSQRQQELLLALRAQMRAYLRRTSAKYAERVQAQMGVGNQLGVSSTPSMFINGRMVSGAQPYETFTAIIDEELERGRK